MDLTIALCVFTFNLTSVRGGKNLTAEQTLAF